MTRLLRRSPGSAACWIADSLVSVVLLALVAVPLAQPGQAGANPTNVWAYLLAAAMAIPYAVHRRWPLQALATRSAAVLVYSAGHYAGYPGFPAFAFAFGLALHAERRQALIGYAVTATTLCIALAMQPDALVDTSSWFSSLLVLTVAWLAGDNLRARRARWSDLEERARRLELEREERARQAVTEERLRIARDLHDVVAHSMSVVAVQAGVAHHVIDDRPDLAKQSLSAIETTSRSALVELRRMLGVLRRADEPGGSLAPAPSIADIPPMGTGFADAGLYVTVEIDGSHESTPAGVQLSAYRIVQEALTNALRYGGRTAFVRINASPSEVVIEVSNPSRNADTGAAVSGGGHGLMGMRERAAVFGGALDAGPTPDGGFRVRATLGPGNTAPARARERSSVGPGAVGTDDP